MSSLQSKAAALSQILNQYKLCKHAEEDVEHTELLDQDNLGKEMQTEVEGRAEGNYASNPADVSKPVENVRQEEGVQDLNASAEDALAAEGTDVKNVGTPLQQMKSASYKARLAAAFGTLKKAASAKQETPMIYTGTSAFQKMASAQTEAEIRDAHNYFEKLASTNPVFAIAREVAGMYKRAEDIEALSEAAGISPEQAAEALDQAVEADPEAAAELQDEVDGAAVADLAEAEQATGELLGGIDEMAAAASDTLGVEVTPDDIVAAAEEVVEQADELGVEPEELIAAAVNEMSGEGATDIVPEGGDEEAMAMAQQILDDAAANGVSPDEVLQVAAEALGGDAPAEDVEAGEAEDELPAEKVAALQKLSGTRRGRLLLGL